MLRSIFKPAIERSYLEPTSIDMIGSLNTYRLSGADALPAFDSAMRMRTDLLSTLPLDAYDGETALDVLPPLVVQPDPTEDRQATLARMSNSLILRREFVAVLGDFDEYGYANSLKVIDSTSASRNPDGSWLINGNKYPAEEILHVMPNPMPGQTRGASIEDQFRRTINGELEAQRFQSDFYRDGGIPTVIVSVNRPGIKPEELSKYKEGWMNKLSGRREPIFVAGDITATPLFLNNRDSQFIESRQWAVSEIANMVGVPPYYLGAPGTSNTYANVQDERRTLLDIYLRGHLYAIERAFSRVTGIKVKFDTQSFLRLDAKTTAEVLQTQAFFMTLDEVREVQGLPPLPNGVGQQIASQFQPGASNLVSEENANAA